MSKIRKRRGSESNPRDRGSSKSKLPFRSLSAQEREYVSNLRSLAIAEDDTSRRDFLALIIRNPERAKIFGETLKSILDACPELLDPEMPLKRLLLEIRTAILTSAKIEIFKEEVGGENK